MSDNDQNPKTGRKPKDLDDETLKEVIEEQGEATTEVIRNQYLDRKEDESSLAWNALQEYLKRHEEYKLHKIGQYNVWKVQE